VDDLRRVDVIRSSLGSDEGIADCLVRTQIVSCETAYPLALAALQKGLIPVHRMHRALAGAGVDLRGVHTDGIFFTLQETREWAAQRRELEAALTMYALKELPGDDEAGAQKLHLAPRCVQKRMPPPAKPYPPKPEMRTLEEHQFEDAFLQSFGLPLPNSAVKQVLEIEGRDTSWEAGCVHLVVENRGALITGMPGTGKSRLVPAIVAKWRADRHNDPVVVMAPTHVAVRLVWGETIQRCNTGSSTPS